MKNMSFRRYLKLVVQTYNKKIYVKAHFSHVEISINEYEKKNEELFIKDEKYDNSEE